MILEILNILLWAVAIVIILSGLDDLFIDISYWWFKKKYSRELPTLKEINDAKEKPIALIIGCWMEYDVIGRTVNLALKNLKYKNYRIFVAVYQNDDKTIAEVRKYSDNDPRVIMAINPKNGPTSKADNLNNAYRCIKSYEEQYGDFGVILIHDSEDFIHPLSMKLYNYLIIHKGYDAVQIPVVPIKSEVGRLFHRTYCDAFAEVHTKDVIVRQALGSFVPFAGTGMAFNRKVFYYMEDWDRNYLDILKKFAPVTERQINEVENSDNIAYIIGPTEEKFRIFNDGNLTEDYELGLKLHKLGFKVYFVNLMFKDDKLGDIIATKGYFPNAFWPAVKQRSRWIAGINLQNWKIHKWQGNLITRYFLLRDRKGLFTNLFLLTSTLFFLYCVLYVIDENLSLNVLMPIINTSSYLFYSLLSAMLFLAIRIFHRIHFTNKWYGPRYAIFSVGRLFVDNVVNFFATIRAIKVFLAVKGTNKTLVWDKTDHY
jgi:adsorption protein B